jgi:hypothetical protein
MVFSDKFKRTKALIAQGQMKKRRLVLAEVVMQDTVTLDVTMPVSSASNP